MNAGVHLRRPWRWGFTAVLLLAATGARTAAEVTWSHRAGTAEAARTRIDVESGTLRVGALICHGGEGLRGWLSTPGWLVGPVEATGLLAELAYPCGHGVSSRVLREPPGLRLRPSLTLSLGAPTVVAVRPLGVPEVGAYLVLPSLPWAAGTRSPPEGGCYAAVGDGQSCRLDGAAVAGTMGDLGPEHGRLYHAAVQLLGAGESVELGAAAGLSAATHHGPGWWVRWYGRIAAGGATLEGLGAGRSALYLTPAGGLPGRGARAGAALAVKIGGAARAWIRCDRRWEWGALGAVRGPVVPEQGSVGAGLSVEAGMGVRARLGAEVEVERGIDDSGVRTFEGSGRLDVGVEARRWTLSCAVDGSCTVPWHAPATGLQARVEASVELRRLRLEGWVEARFDGDTGSIGLRQAGFRTALDHGEARAVLQLRIIRTDLVAGRSGWELEAQASLTANPRRRGGGG